MSKEREYRDTEDSREMYERKRQHLLSFRKNTSGRDYQQLLEQIEYNIKIIAQIEVLVRDLKK